MRSADPVVVRASTLKAQPCLSAHLLRRGAGELDAAPVADLLDIAQPYVVGEDPGSDTYVSSSQYTLMRTRALQSDSAIPQMYGEANAAVHKSQFVNMDLKSGDIVMAKDSNVGEVAMLSPGNWSRVSLSGGLVKLNTRVDPYLLFGFLKFGSFRDQVIGMTPRGATLRHAGSRWLHASLAIPGDGTIADRIAHLARSIVALESLIARAQRQAFNHIQAMLGDLKVRGGIGVIRVKELNPTSRLDTGLYSARFRSYEAAARRISGSLKTLHSLGVKTRRGPNLAESVIGTPVYSDDYVKGWYELIRPMNISEYGFLRKREWLGTDKVLSLVSGGDILIGCEGFDKGRTCLLPRGLMRCTTNFHAVALSWPGKSQREIAGLRMMLAFLRDIGVVDAVGAGGNGGHMSPEYFEQMPMPDIGVDGYSSLGAYYDADMSGSILSLNALRVNAISEIMSLVN